MSTTVATPAIEQGDIIAGLEKGLAVLCLFSVARTRLTIADAARETEISRAAARRVLLTLVQGGYVTSDGKFFMPTARVLRLSRGYLESGSLMQRIQPVLDRISAQTGESSSAAILDASDIVYVARSATRRIMSVGLGVGSRLPAYATSMGRVLLAFGPETKRQKILRSGPYPALTPRSITSAEALRQELARIRAEGYALVDEELELGLRSIAVPVLQADAQVEMAINVSVSSSQMTVAEMIGRLLPVLKKAQAEQ